MNFDRPIRQFGFALRYHVAAVVASLLVVAAPVGAANDDRDMGSHSPAVVATNNDTRSADALYFGQLALTRGDITLLAQGFDDNGVPVLDVALQPDAATRLEAETLRLLDTDVTISLGPATLISARLVEPITEGKLRISGRFTVPETQAMARQIICALKLSADQFDPPSLARKLPCDPGKAR